MEKEAEIYNNPQNFVTYAKLERQINILRKKLEMEKINNQSSKSNNLMNLIPKKIYLRICIEAVFYLINLIVVILYRSEKIIIDSNEMIKNNLVIDYFSIDGKIIISFFFIIILQGFFINRVENLIYLINSLIK